MSSSFEPGRRPITSESTDTSRPVTPSTEQKPLPTEQKPLPKVPSSSDLTSPKAIPIARIEDVSTAFKIVPKFVRDIVYSKPILEFTGRIIDSEELLVKLPAVNFKTIHPSSFERLKTADAIHELDNAQLDAFTPEITSHISDEATAAFSIQQARYLLTQKLDSFDSAEKIMILDAICSDKSGRSLLSPMEQIKAEMNTWYLADDRSPRDYSQQEILLISPAIIQRNPDKISALGNKIAYLDANQLKAIGESHIAAMTSAQAVLYAQHNERDIPQNLIYTLLKKIPSSPENEDLRNNLANRIHISEKARENDLNLLRPGGIENLKPEDIVSFVREGKIKDFSPGLLRQVALTNPKAFEALDKSQIREFSREQFSNIPLRSILNLPNGKYFEARKFDFSGLSGVDNFEIKRLLKEGIFQEISDDQIQTVYSGILLSLNEDDWNLIPGNQLKLLTDLQINGLQPKVIEKLPPNKLNEIYNTLGQRISSRSQLVALRDGIEKYPDIPGRENMLSSLNERITRIDRR